MYDIIKEIGDEIVDETKIGNFISMAKYFI